MSVELTPEQIRDAALAKWETDKLVLEAAKLAEMESRKLAFTATFGNEAKVGTTRVPLANGYEAKGVRKTTFTLDKDFAKLNAAYDAICAVGNEGGLLAGRILKRVYDFGEGEYKKLDPANPTHAAIKLLVDAVLTTKDGAPTLEIVAPKNAA